MHRHLAAGNSEYTVGAAPGIGLAQKPKKLVPRFEDLALAVPVCRAPLSSCLDLCEMEHNEFRTNFVIPDHY